MLKLILDILKNSEADDYEVSEIKREGWEFYFIKHNLDQNRGKSITNYNVTVYKKSDDKKFVGFASGDISPSLNPDEVKKVIDDLIFQASLTKNQNYELNEFKEADDLDIKNIDIEKEAENFINCFNNIKETDNEYLNSYEIFIEKITKHFINSKGIDIIDTYPLSTIDIVVNAKKDNHEIELYRIYDQGTCDRENIENEINDLLRFGKDRLIATETPKLKDIPIIFSTNDALEIYRYFLSKMNAAQVFRGLSNFKIDEEIFDDVKGDKITLKSLRYLENSSQNFKYDQAGAPIKDLILIDNNIPKHYVGSKQFSDYLDLKDSFIVSNYEVEGGNKTAEEIRQGQYLEVVEFSNFQVNQMTGDVFGEIRLAYYHDGEKIIPVSGGSISGNMKDAAKEMYLSKESKKYDNAKIPAVTKLNNLLIAGIK